MKIYNTLSKRKEEFVPLEEGKVKMYVCGPTVYNFIHIGNARPMIAFDTVRRYFEYKGFEVNFVSNFTDVDDKIIKKAIEEAVNVTLEYDTGTDGFDERMQTELFTGAPPTCFPPGARARRSANGLKRTSLSISPRSSMLSLTATPRCTKSSTATSTRLTTSCTQAMKTPPMPFIPWPRLRTPAFARWCPCTSTAILNEVNEGKNARYRGGIH